MADQLWAVIMAGGGGTRFWPLSRRSRPKQFLAVIGEKTLLQLSWDRALAVAGDPARVVVVTGRDYEEMTRRQLPELAADNLLLEPQARDTAPCIAWAAAELARRDPQAAMAVLPADHLIRDLGAFVSAVATARAAAHRHGMLVTFGIPPRYPEPGYGYIELGEALEVDVEGGAEPVHRVVRVREKPGRTTAEAWVETGNHLWNSGIFVWTMAGIQAALERYLIEAAEAAAQMVEAPDDDARAAAWAAMPATSIDFGVMERADNVACVRAPFDWSDVGTWATLHEVSEADAEGNVCWGTTVTLEARDNLVHAPGELVALLGVEGLAVVRAGDALLVARLDRAQEVKALRRRLVERGLQDHL